MIHVLFSSPAQNCTPTPEPGTRVTLNSPGWNTANGYEHYTDCEWTLQVTGGSDSDVSCMRASVLVQGFGER